MGYMYKCESCNKFNYLEKVDKKYDEYCCSHCNTKEYLDKDFQFKNIDFEKFNDKYTEGTYTSKQDKNDFSIKISKEEAKERLKESKENLDLELITQKEYDVLKEELKPIIMSESDDLKPSEKIGKDEKNTSKKGSNVMVWVVSMSLLGGGLGWILTSGGSSSNTTEDGSYDHCSSIRAEQFLYSNSRAIKSQLQNVTLYSEKGNIFTFGHISYPYNQLRNLECITKVICQSDGSYAIYDVDCKTF